MVRIWRATGAGTTRYLESGREAVAFFWKEFGLKGVARESFPLAILLRFHRRVGAMLGEAMFHLSR